MPPKENSGVNCPAAAAGPASGSEEPLARREGLPPGLEPFRGGAWLGGSYGALKFKTYFHLVIPAEAGIQGFP